MKIGIVTVSGLPGSGTSTTCKLLSERLGWAYVDAGQIFRHLAREAGLSLAEFGRRAEADGTIDRQLDARMVEVGRGQAPVILEGRLTGWMARRHGLEALKVWLEASPQVRARRVAGRDGQTLEQARKAMEERQVSETRRYQEHHGIDLGDLSLYDLVIDTGRCKAPKVVREILARLPEEEE
jgi:predicted cytidylate kinase